MRPLGVDADFSGDIEFAKLLVRQDDVDLATAALELARDTDPTLDFAATLRWLDQRAEELSGPVARAGDERSMLETLAGCLSDTHGLTGSADAFHTPGGSYLPDVIASGHGIPISLAVIYIAVATRLRIDLAGISTPMHFLCRLETPVGPLFLDAFSDGRVMDESGCLEWLSGRSGLSESELAGTLDPVSTRLIIIRMLNNLKNLFVGRQDWRPARRTQQRLAMLQPASSHERRDLAVITLKAGRPDQALTMLENCLKSASGDDARVLRGLVDEAHSALAGWN